MDLRQLSHVTMLAKHLNFTKAAEELGISQSALSKSIQAIEARKGVRLFDRDRGGVRPTALGCILSRKAASVLAEAKELEWHFTRAATGDSGEVAFGMAPLPAKALLPTILARTMRHHPKLSCRVAVRSAESLMAALLSEEIELFLCAEGLVAEGAPVIRESVGSFPTAFLARPGHPVFSNPDDDASAYPLLVPGGTPMNALSPARTASMLPHVRYAIEDFGVLAKLAELSDGIWITSTFAAHEEIERGNLKQVPLALDQIKQSFRMMVYSLPNRTLSTAAKTIRRECRREIKALKAAADTSKYSL